MDEKIIYLEKDDNGTAVFCMLHSSQVSTTGEWQAITQDPIPIPDINGKVIAVVGDGFYHKDGKRIN